MVPKFSGDGAVTKMFAYPCAMAPAIAKPSAADLPRPRAAVSATVPRSDFSWSASVKVITARAWSCVKHFPTSRATGSSACCSFNVACSSSSCASMVSTAAPTSPSSSSPSAPPVRSFVMPCDVLEMVSTLSSSSHTRHVAHEESERMKRSLKRGTTSAYDSVRKRLCTSIVIV